VIFNVQEITALIDNATTRRSLYDSDGEEHWVPFVDRVAVYNELVYNHNLSRLQADAVMKKYEHLM